jgi:hypothetical protein
VSDTCGPGVPCPSGNTDCTSPNESCIDDVCRALAPTGSACDAPNDDDDCMTGNECIDGTCLRSDGEQCTSNSQCVNVCIGTGTRTCAPASATNEPCDTSDGDADCQAGHLCVAGECLLIDDQPCTNNTQCVNVCIIDHCDPKSGLDGPCDQNSDCTDGTCVSDVCAPEPPLRIFVTAASHDGNFTSLSAADNFCRNDADNPLGAGNGSWAAMLGIAGAREVGSGWIMEGSSSYYRTDGTTLIDYTDANGWLGGGLTEAVRSPALDVWTGLDSETGHALADNCAGWTSASGTSNGGFGSSASTGRQWVESGTAACTHDYRVYCVEQR